jgi:SanA protein
VLLITAVWLSNWYVTSSTEDQIYSSVEAIPKKKVALVLGAARYGNGHHENPYFTYRMEAAAELYLNGKVEHILVSGDNHIESYNEPEDMLNKLVELGVPASKVTLDFAGFRTFDSMIRAKEIFGVDDFIVVSQKYHLQRALYIANANGISALGYTAEDVYYHGVNLREKLAKFKAVLDCSILFTSPKFLGEKEPISLN